MRNKERSREPIIEKTIDLILWYSPFLSRLPKDHKFILGENMIRQLYKLLEGLNNALFIKIPKKKLAILDKMNAKLELLRIQSDLLERFDGLTEHECDHVVELINGIGRDAGGLAKYLRKQEI
ncbi:MAG: diversity-generating retroelement protein Avd [Calothrix sp. SM1_7_51]|nr:diversity-generating retroelement protein Avd [Calothrix sp. SM1_7_51]